MNQVVTQQELSGVKFTELPGPEALYEPGSDPAGVGWGQVDRPALYEPGSDPVTILGGPKYRNRSVFLTAWKMTIVRAGESISAADISIRKMIGKCRPR